MREIKFRAWHKELKMYFSVSDLQYKGNRLDNVLLVKVGGNGALVKRENINDIILEQYTGLRDVNGVEIYEGDIIKLDLGHLGKTKSIIKWHKQKLRFYYDVSMVDNLVFKSDYKDYIEVIGNIHEGEKVDE